MVLDELTNDLQLIVWPDVEVRLHAFNDRLLEVVRLNLEHDLEWEALQDSQLAAEIVRVLVDG